MTINNDYNFSSDNIIENIRTLAHQHYNQCYQKRIEVVMDVGLIIDNYLQKLYQDNTISQYSCVLYKRKESSDHLRRKAGCDYFYYITFFKDKPHEFSLTVE